jgi:hypothetical protein
MTLPITHGEQATIPTAFKVQRYALAACMLLAPLSSILFVYSWSPDLLRTPILASAQVGPVRNVMHLSSGVAASFFLPLGFLGMSLLGMRRAPWLATISATVSLLGWIPWGALISIDVLGYDIFQFGSTPQLATLWAHFNYDPFMLVYLITYIIGGVGCRILIGIMLARLRLIPAWSAWALAITGPLQILSFVPSPLLAIRNVMGVLIFALWIIGTIPAALAMIKNREPLEHAPSPV